MIDSFKIKKEHDLFKRQNEKRKTKKEKKRVSNSIIINYY